MKVSVSCLWKSLRRLGLTLKKSLRAAEQDRAMSPRRVRDGAPASPI